MSSSVSAWTGSPGRLAQPRRGLVAWLLVAALCLPVAPAMAGDADAAVRIKLAYLYNFMKFVYWPPAQADAPVLCIAGDPALAALAEQQIAGRKLRGLALQVRAVETTVEGCQLLYSRAPPAAAAGPVLLVGEGRAFLDRGGMIGFAIVQDRVRFSVHLGRLRAAGLRADAQLLTAALEVLQ